MPLSPPPALTESAYGVLPWQVCQQSETQNHSQVQQDCHNAIQKDGEWFCSNGCQGYVTRVVQENIKFFLRALREFGVPEFECFDTQDLYEEKNLDAVSGQCKV